MKQSENYKNITESNSPPLDRMETQDTIPTVHKPNTIPKTSPPTRNYNGTKSNLHNK